MKIFTKLTVLSFLCLAQIQAKTLPEINEVISCDQLAPGMIQEFAEGMYPQMAIEFPQGASIPLQFLVNCKIFSLRCNPNLSVKIDTTYYLRSLNNKVYISLDMTTWEKASHFFRGTLIPSVQRSKDHSAILVQADLVEFEEGSEE